MLIQAKLNFSLTFLVLFYVKKSIETHNSIKHISIHHKDAYQPRTIDENKATVPSCPCKAIVCQQPQQTPF